MGSGGVGGAPLLPNLLSSPALPAAPTPINSPLCLLASWLSLSLWDGRVHPLRQRGSLFQRPGPGHRSSWAPLGSVHFLLPASSAPNPTIFFFRPIRLSPILVSLLHHPEDGLSRFS